MAMRKSILAMILTFGLIVVSGCANSQKKAAEQAMLDAQDDNACRISGASPGSQQYSECRARLGEQRGVTKWQDQDRSRYSNNEALMQAGVPPTNRR